MTATTTEITKEQTDKLKSETDALEVVYNRLQTAYSKAATHLQTLRVERAALPDTKHEAILMGDAAAYTRVLERERAIFGELVIGEVALARSRVAYLEAGKNWQVALRDFASLEAQRVGGDLPEGKQKHIDATNFHEGARASLASMSSLLGEAQRALDEAIRRAQNLR